jgi:hypothetical protein
MSGAILAVGSGAAAVGALLPSSEVTSRGRVFGLLALGAGASAVLAGAWVRRGAEQEQRGLRLAALASIVTGLGSLVLLSREIKKGAVLTAKVASYLTSMIVAFHVAAFCESKWDMSQKKSARE